MANSGKATLVLAGLITFLGLQFAFALSWSEQFPAVIMPGFPGHPASTGKTTIRAYRVVATEDSGSQFAVGAPEFFNQLPRWYLLTDLPFILDSAPPEPTGLHFRQRLERHAKLRSDAALPAFATYAQKRLTELTGRGGWRTLRIDETRRDFDIDGLTYVDSARVVRSREFQLR